MLKFAKACQKLCVCAIYPQQIAEADNLLKQFCVCVSELFGSAACTINMHKHLHLKECVEQFGPIYSFWCFPFERFNGKLGSYHTNSKNIEVQIVRKFLRDQCVATSMNTSTSEELHSESSISKDRFEYILNLQQCNFPTSQFRFCLDEIGHSTHTMGLGRQDVLTLSQQKVLENVYRALYGNFVTTMFALQVEVYHTVTICSERLTAMPSSQSQVSVIWPPAQSQKRIGKIINFFMHTMEISGKTTKLQHLFATIHFYSQHPHEALFNNERILVAWPELDTSITNSWCFVPVHRISGICAHGELPIQLPDGLKQVLMVSNVLPFNCTVHD